MKEIKQCRDYSDENGNRIIGSAENFSVVFSGSNSTLKIGGNCRIEGIKIQLASNCHVEIGEETTIKGSLWNFYDDSCCIIGKNCRFRDGGFMSAAQYSRITLNDGFTTEHQYIIIALPYTEICFGEDCMVSRFVTIQSNDGHDIFDVNTGENINASEETARARKILIGSHVWIGQGATVLYNTEIGDGSIVGAQSLVKNKFPNNCVIGGNPARMLKKDIAWSRGYGGTDINVIDKKYVKPTSEN